MIRLSLIAIPLICLLSCTASDTSKQQAMQKQIDSMQAQLAKLKPGLGEFMLSVQIHHAKLWFAGKNNNWQLANFEIDEIKEQFANAAAIETDRPEIKSLPMIYPALDSISKAITDKDSSAFNRNFHVLTNTCNSCHKAVNFDFNVVKVPDSPPFSNQVFGK